MPEITIGINVEVVGIHNLLDDIKKITFKRLENLMPNIYAKSQEIVEKVLIETPEYKSLKEDKGRLRQELGIANSQITLEDIIHSIQKAVKVELINGNSEFLGGINIGIYKSDFSDALSSKYATYISETKHKSLLIPWLSWLLFDGDKIVILDKYGLFTHAKKGSRTGDHIMVKLKEGGKLQPWRIPPQFAGNISSNWLTKTAEESAPILLSYLESELRKF